MANTPNSLIQFDKGGRDPLNLFKVLQGASFTVPDTVTTDSPTDNANFDSIRTVGGGQIIVGFSDEAVTNLDNDFVKQLKLEPGDVVACSAVASNTITVTVTSKSGQVRAAGRIEGVTAVGGVIGFYG